MVCLFHSLKLSSVPEPASLPQPFKLDRVKVVSFSTPNLSCSPSVWPGLNWRIRHAPRSRLGHFPFLVFYICFSDIIWQLYNVDCKRAPDVLRRHPDFNRISGFLSFFLPVLAIEVDMPWMEGLTETYGESFRPWTEEDFSQAINNVIAALPHNRLATIVSFLFFLYCF